MSIASRAKRALESPWTWPWFFVAYAASLETLFILVWDIHPDLSMFWVGIHWVLNPALALAVGLLTLVMWARWDGVARRVSGLLGVAMCWAFAVLPYWHPIWPYEYIWKNQ